MLERLKAWKDRPPLTFNDVINDDMHMIGGDESELVVATEDENEAAATAAMIMIQYFET